MDVTINDLETETGTTMPLPLNQDFWFNGKRVCTLSISPTGVPSIQWNGQASIRQSPTSFYARKAAD